MQRELLITNDGSHTITIPSLGLTYHSHHGAIQESMHVFIKSGLEHYIQTNKVTSPVSIFEMGFGTGLNALLTLIKAEELQVPVTYETIELYPIEDDLAKSLNYCAALGRPDLESVFLSLHESDWETDIRITPWFTIKKIKKSIMDFAEVHNYQLIYFDAFAPGEQPEIWTAPVFLKLFGMMQSGGILVTYCSKSEVRRALTGAGFEVKKPQGPWGKREMLRARKP